MQRQFFAFITGMLISIIIGVNIFGPEQFLNTPKPAHSEVHVHSDFLVYLDGKVYDFTADQYQTSAEQTLHQDIHLHDNEDEVIHRHNVGITLGEFFTSLGVQLSKDCIQTSTDKQFCSDDTNKLLLYINEEPTTDIASYVNQEEDQLLLYYGDPTDPIVSELTEQITDYSCIYSGTCPERGVAPPESCGLTCEI